MHELGVAHCDIKPDNILVDQEMATVKVSAGLLRRREMTLEGAGEAMAGDSTVLHLPVARHDSASAPLTCSSLPHPALTWPDVAWPALAWPGILFDQLCDLGSALPLLDLSEKAPTAYVIARYQSHIEKAPTAYVIARYHSHI